MIFALAIVTALGPSILDSAIAIGVGWVPIYVRVVRTPVLSLRESDFVRAGKVLGYSRTRLLFHHILPNVTGVIRNYSDSHGLCFSVKHEDDGTTAGYDPDELTIIYER